LRQTLLNMRAAVPLLLCALVLACTCASADDAAGATAADDFGESDDDTKENALFTQPDETGKRPEGSVLVEFCTS